MFAKISRLKLSLCTVIVISVTHAESPFPFTADGSGDAGGNAESSSRQSDQVLSRRWSSTQSRDFMLLHSALAYYVLHTDVSSLRDGMICCVATVIVLFSLNMKYS